MKKIGLLLLAISLTVACNSTPANNPPTANTAPAPAPSPKFSDADIQKTEADIRAKYEQKGFVVEQVSLIRDSDRHLSGFAKMAHDQKVGLLRTKLVEVMKNCAAAMDENTRQYIWECK